MNIAKKIHSLGDIVFSQWLQADKRKNTAPSELSNQLRSLILRLLLQIYLEKDRVEWDFQSKEVLERIKPLQKYRDFNISLDSFDFNDVLSQDIVAKSELRELADHFIKLFDLVPVTGRLLTIIEAERTKSSSLGNLGNLIEIQGSNNIQVKNTNAGDGTIIPIEVNISELKLHIYNEMPKNTSIDVLTEMTDQKHLFNYLDKFLEEHEFPTWETISSTRKINIRQIYVKLNVASDGTEKSTENSPENEGLRVLTVPQALRDSKGRLLILGDPGAGKTTLLKYIGLIFAEASRFSEKSNLAQTELGIDDAGLIPIFVSIGSYVARLQGKRRITPTSLLWYIEKAINQYTQNEMSFKTVNTYINRGKCVFLLDGLDEVSNPDIRDSVIHMLNKFIGDPNYGSNHFVITSRILGYRNAVKLQVDFLESIIRPFDVADIRQFVENYCKAATLASGLDKYPPDTHPRELEDYLRENLLNTDITTATLVSRIFGNTSLFNITTNPLLLTIICIVFYPRVAAGDRSSLPSRRIELLKECTDVLIEKWTRARGDSSENHRNFSNDTERQEWQECKLLLLSKIAFKMQETGKYDLAVREVRKLTQQQITKEFLQEQYQRIKSLFFTETAAILHNKETGTFSFVHPNIREYLAAIWIFHQEKITARLISSHINDNAWHEVIVYALALLADQRPDTAKLVFDSLQSTVEQLEISAKALIELGSRHQNVLSLIDKTRTGLLRTIQANTIYIRRRLHLADLLGQLGDPRVRPEEPPQTILVDGDVIQLTSYNNESLMLDSFHAGVYLVTNEQFYRFVQDNKKYLPAHWRKDGYPSTQPTHPVVDIPWEVCN